MLNRRRDDVVSGAIAAPQNSPESRIIRFGAAGCEYNFTRLRSKKLRNVVTGIFDACSCLLPVAVDGTRIAEVIAEARQHSFQNELINLSRPAII